MKGRNGAFWNTSYNYSYTYVNNRVTAYTTAGASRPELVWQYDADGRELTSYTDYFRRGDQVYDAAGGLTKIIDYALTGSTPMSEAFRHQDGDGREAKRTNRIYNTTTSTWEDLPARYYIASSVLNGEVVSDVDETGRKLATNIFASGRMIARQMITYSTTAGDSYQVEWKNQDSYALSDLRTRKHAQSSDIDGAQYAPMELDPAGTELSGLMPEGGGGIDPEIPELDPNGGGVDGPYYTGDPNYYRRGLGGGGSPGCAIYGSLIDCSRIRFADGYGNGIFSSLERAVRESVRQTGTRTRVRELVAKQGTRPPVLRNGGSGPSGQRISADGESILLGYESWTEPIYANWSVIPQTQQQQEDPRIKRYRGLANLVLGTPPPPDSRDRIAELVIGVAASVLNDATNACTKALQRAGILGQIQGKLDSANFLSVSANGSASARSYFSDANQGETISAYYTRFHGAATNVGRSNLNAILTMNGASSFITFRGSADGRGNDYHVGFFLHEMAHHATGRTDLQLAAALLGIPVDGGESEASAKLDEFFNNGCPIHLGTPPPLPARR